MKVYTIGFVGSKQVGKTALAFKLAGLNKNIMHWQNHSASWKGCTMDKKYGLYYVIDTPNYNCLTQFIHQSGGCGIDSFVVVIDVTKPLQLADYQVCQWLKRMNKQFNIAANKIDVVSTKFFVQHKQTACVVLTSATQSIGIGCMISLAVHCKTIKYIRTSITTSGCLYVQNQWQFVALLVRHQLQLSLRPNVVLGVEVLMDNYLIKLCVAANMDCSQSYKSSRAVALVEVHLNNLTKPQFKNIGCINQKGVMRWFILVPQLSWPLKCLSWILQHKRTSTNLGCWIKQLLLIQKTRFTSTSTQTLNRLIQTHSLTPAHQPITTHIFLHQSARRTCQFVVHNCNKHQLQNLCTHLKLILAKRFRLKHPSVLIRTARNSS